MMTFKRRFTAILLCLVYSFMLGISASAEEPSVEQAIQPRAAVTTGNYSFYINSTDMYLNINNNNSGTASVGDRVIIYDHVYTNDEVWTLTAAGDGCFYVRSALNPVVALNYYHDASNHCTLFPPENNYTYDSNGVRCSDSKLQVATSILLIDWNLRLDSPKADTMCDTQWTYPGRVWANKRV